MEHSSTTSKMKNRKKKIKLIIVEDTTLDCKGQKHELGQYFTTDIGLQNKVVEFIRNETNIILEPSVGQGHLVQAVCSSISNITFHMYEIDTNVKLIEGLSGSIIYGDFITQSIKCKYKTIIGNPPFVKTKNGNLYIDFIEKCYNLLEDNGELIFIIPSDFFKLTSASKLLNVMITNGTFTDIYHPHKENLFENASIDVLVFRYCKNNSIEKKVLYNNVPLHLSNNDGMVTFNKYKQESLISFKEFFDVYVGLVTGKECVYKNKELGNMELLNKENKKEKYIFINKFPCEDKKINEYLLSHKEELISRKIKRFNESNWFEWGAPRNIKTIKKNLGKDCIYIYNLTRSEKIAFKGKVTYFGGGLIILIPKENSTIKLDNIVDYLNSKVFKGNFMFSGRFKIGHRQISNSYIPDN